MMRIEFYTHVHKKQRNMLFALSQKVGDANFTDTITINDIYNDLISATNELRHHASSEETFVHPLLMQKIPHIERELHEDHKILKKYLEDLETTFAHIRELPPHYKKHEEQGLEFYRMLNRFISTYFIHINEEEYVMQNLREVAMEPELTAMMIAFQTDDDIEKGKTWLINYLPSMTLDERKLLFKTTELLAPENIFMTMCQLGEKILGTKQWEKIFEPQVYNNE